MSDRRTGGGKPTIVDVAFEAGVSRSTAGRALSGHPSVDPTTREQVLAAAERLHYRADPTARALRSGNSRLIGLIVTNLVNASIQVLVEAVHAHAHANGFQVLMAVTNGDRDREQQVLAELAGQRVAGLIVMSSASNPAQLHALHESGVAVVEVIRRPKGIRTPVVLNDDRAGAMLATQHLVDLGHREIAFIGGPTSTHSGNNRYTGYVNVLSGNGLEVNPRLVWHGPFKPEWGAQTATELFRSTEPFSAVLVANHEAMFGVLNAAAQQGVQIPEELSLVGFEDAPLFRYWHPAITVVDTDPASLAGRAWESLAAAMSEPGSRVTREVVPARLVERESVSKLTGGANAAPLRETGVNE